MYSDEGVNAVLVASDNLDTEGRSFIPQQLDAVGEASGVHTT